jgi:L-amino acid N-acyltransferase
MKVRKATAADVAAITEIYNDAVINTSATFDTELKTAENRKHWLLDRTMNFPVLVAHQDDAVIGYASLSRWSDKKAYDITAELSLYIHPAHRNKGVGRMLFKALLDEARNHTTLHSILSRITEGNDQSIHLHLKEGFQTVGVLRECGMKFGKLLDVTILQLILAR